MSFAFQANDLDLLATLPPPVVTELRELLIAFRQIHSNVRTFEPSNLKTASSQEARIRQQASLLAISPITLRKKYFTYIRSGGDWRTLVNKAKAGPAWWSVQDCIGLPRKFVEFYKTLVERNQRSDAAAHAELKQIYRTGIDTTGKRYTSIPGYQSRDREGASADPSTPENSLISNHSQSAFRAPAASSPQSAIRNPQSAIPPNPLTGLPRGWSYENLTRHTASAFEKSAMRQGRFAASNHRRKVFTTRAGLQVGQIIMFDDQEYDLKVNYFGHSTLSQRKAMRPLGFNALCLYSACNFSYAFKPTLIDDETDRKQKLRDHEFRAFLASVVTGTGYNPDTGTQFVVEHGTAAISESLEALLADLSAGKISVARSGIFGSPSTAAQFEGSARGNPRFKAPLESFFNLVRNRFAALPGQTGLSRDRSPDELAGRDAYNNSLLKAIAQRPDLAHKLRLPFFEWNEFVSIATELYRLINDREDHDLEGWAKCGHFAREWRTSITSQHWLPMTEFEALSPELQMAYAASFQKPENAALTRCRPLSPREVFTRGATRLQRLPLSTIPLLLGEQNATLRRVVNGYITLDDQDLSSDPLRFPCASVLSDREKYLCYLTAAPQSEIRNSQSAILVVADARNRYLATLEQQTVPCRADLDAVKREMGAAKAEEAALLAPIRARHAAAAREKTRMHTHNAAILSGQPITPEDRAANEAFNHALEANVLPPEKPAFIDPYQ